MAAGSSHAMTPFGAVDIAGNVREWCFNSAPAGRCLRGGATNFQINIVKDVMRSVDYLQSRPDIQADKIAYFGFTAPEWS